MKLTVFIAGCIATVLAVALFWLLIANDNQTRQELATVIVRLDEMERQLDEVSRFQMLLQQYSNTDNEASGSGAAKPTRQTDDQVNERVQNQSRANDNQWQQIDFLKSQQVFHRRLIDQLNFDLDKMNRDHRQLERQMRQR